VIQSDFAVLLIPHTLILLPVLPRLAEQDSHQTDGISDGFEHISKEVPFESRHRSLKTLIHSIFEYSH
jgi:hypothetical protein